MKQIRIKKEFWDKIVSGEKQYEFRKLSKGLESGTYRFVSDEYNDGYMGHVYGEPKEIFGTAKLRPVALNPKLWQAECSYWVDNDYHQIDKGTYDFVKENYIDEGIDFIVYEISEEKDVIS